MYEKVCKRKAALRAAVFPLFLKKPAGVVKMPPPPPSGRRLSTSMNVPGCFLFVHIALPYPPARHPRSSFFSGTPDKWGKSVPIAQQQLTYLGIFLDLAEQLGISPLRPNAQQLVLGAVASAPASFFKFIRIVAKMPLQLVIGIVQCDRWLLPPPIPLHDSWVFTSSGYWFRVHAL